VAVDRHADEAHGGKMPFPLSILGDRYGPGLAACAAQQSVQMCPGVRQASHLDPAALFKMFRQRVLTRIKFSTARGERMTLLSFSA
jgi:hypothetical protein